MPASDAGDATPGPADPGRAGSRPSADAGGGGRPPETGLLAADVLDRLDPGCIREEPFPHAVVHDALPEPLYAALEAAWPAPDRIAGGALPADHRALRLGARAMLADPSLPAVWRDFAARHTSHAFFLRFVRLFGEAVMRTHPRLEREFGKPLEAFTTARRVGDGADFPGHRDADVMLDAQLVINTPVRRTSRVRGAHLDGPTELFAGLLYVPVPGDDTPGGELEILRLRRGRHPWPRPGRVDPRDVEVVERVPYRRNTLVFFVNSPRSLHAVTPRPPTPFVRRYVNLIGDCFAHPDPEFFTAADPGAPRWWRRATARGRRIAWRLRHPGGMPREA